VTVVSSDDVTWRDGSLGCPEPGMGYTQALEPGTRTILEVGGKQYHYHSSAELAAVDQTVREDARFRLCGGQDGKGAVGMTGVATATAVATIVGALAARLIFPVGHLCRSEG
jgi:hypothetical protein